MTSLTTAFDILLLIGGVGLSTFCIGLWVGYAMGRVK